MRFASPLCGAALLCLALGGCGYRAGSPANPLPLAVSTIAIPGFENVTSRYKLSDRMPAALTREFIARTRYRVVPDADSADAILRGAVLNYQSFPNVVDQSSGRATGVQLIVSLQLSLTERKTGKVLFSRPSMEVRNRYEISIDQNAYFEESDVALERVSREVARTVVSAVLEAF